MKNNEGSQSKSPLDALVIGAGWSGLLLCHQLLKKGLNVSVLERRSQLGGVWRFTEEPNTVSVMATTETSSSRTTTEISDFPYSKEMGEFPSHWKIADYLERFAKHYNLTERINYNCNVTMIDKTDGLWKVSLEDGRTFQAPRLAICTGTHQLRNPTPDLLRNFSGTIIHSGDIKRVVPDRYRNKRILIFGGGETAADLCAQILPFAKKLYWSIPHGQHFFKKRGRFVGDWTPFLPWFKQDLIAYDTAFNWLLSLITPPQCGKPGMAMWCRWTAGGSFMNYQGHGIPTWKNDAQLDHMFFCKSADVLPYVRRGAVVAKRKVVQCDNEYVLFDDNEKVPFDLIISCVGYHTDSKLFPKGTSPETSYMYVFPPDDPTLAYVGFVRPIILSIPLFAEMASRWVANIWSGTQMLPSSDVMNKEIQETLKRHAEYFKDTSKRLKILVEPADWIARMRRILASTQLKRNILKHPITFMRLLATPFQTRFFTLLDHENSPKMINKLMKEISASNAGFSRAGMFGNIATTLFVAFCRFSGLDFITRKLMKIKYRRQTQGTAKQQGHVLRKRFGRAHDSNVYFSNNPELSQEVIEYYHAKII